MNVDSWLSSAEPGWEPIELPHKIGVPTFLANDDNDRLRVRYFQDVSSGALIAKVRFGSRTQGPPGHAHGGSIAALLDEAMGGAAWIAGHPVVAAEITTRFKKMMPVDACYLARAEVYDVSGRKVRARAELRGLDESLYAEGEGLFVELDMQRLGRLAGAAASFRLRKSRQRSGAD